MHLRALQERHRQMVRGCSPMSLRQYALQHPHRYVLRASLVLFERGLFVHSCPACVRLIASKNRMRIAFVGADRYRFVCGSSNANWRPSSCALRCLHCAGVPWCGWVSLASPPLTLPGPLVASRSRGACARRVCVAARVLAGLRRERTEAAPEYYFFCHSICHANTDPQVTKIRLWASFGV